MPVNTEEELNKESSAENSHIVSAWIAIQKVDESREKLKRKEDRKIMLNTYRDFMSEVYDEIYQTKKTPDNDLVNLFQKLSGSYKRKR